MTDTLSSRRPSSRPPRLLPEATRELRLRYDQHLAAGRLAAAAQLLRQLERSDERGAADWAKRLGDLERRLGRLEQARVAYLRAAGLYRRNGFIARGDALADVAEIIAARQSFAQFVA